MPDPAPASPQPTDRWVQITQMILQTVTFLVTLYIAKLGSSNQDRIEQVQVRQEDAAERTDAVKRVVSRTSESIDEDRLIRLWVNWKYLDSISDTALDKAKAAEAKRIYEEAKKRNGGRHDP